MVRELLSRRLQLPVEHIDKIARSASRRYKTYSVPKRTGGSRIIHHPAKELKVLQRWLLHEVINQWPVHPAAHGYEKGKNTRSNALKHVKSAYLLRMDLRDFFPSLTADDIRQYFAANPNDVAEWNTADIEFFVRIVCRTGKLTIGAPTSPRLSNVLCRHFDTLIADLCDSEGVVYTRYADDLFFSCGRPNVLRRVEARVLEVIQHLERPAELRANTDKTHHSSKKGRRVVTGLRLTQYGKLSSGRPLKRYVRSMIHRYEGLDIEERQKLAGYLAYLRSVEPTYLNNLVIKFGSQKIRLVTMARDRGVQETAKR